MSTEKNIPNELKITINTSVPGFQTIKYNPRMTLKDDKDANSVRFDPLVKLNKSIIEKVPENLRIKEFFNKGQKLNSSSVLYAIRHGYFSIVKYLIEDKNYKVSDNANKIAVTNGHLDIF